MKRILFVDDDDYALQSLRRLMREQRQEWEMEFKPNGEAALAAFADRPFDVIVADMNMSGMDGAELLAEVKERYPNVVRIILSGSTLSESYLKSMGPTHQFLSKPCNADTLKSSILRICAMQAHLENPALLALVSRLDLLPSLPEIYLEVKQAMENPNVSLGKIGELIGHDIGLSVKILRVVNSGFFGLGKPVGNVSHAVSYLGIETVTAIVLAASVFSEFENKPIPKSFLGSLWSHSMQTAAFARAIARAEALDRFAVDDIFISGMLHDIGKLALSALDAERYERVQGIAIRDNVPLWQVEKEEFGATHADVSAYLINLWSLPLSINSAVAFHDNPSNSGEADCRALMVIHAANALARDASITDPRNSREVDGAYLTNLNAIERWPLWREACLNSVGEKVTR